jgi:hypothetical protein
MANEISTNVSITVSTGGQSTTGTIAAQSDLTTAFIGNEQIIGITDETILMGDVPSPPIFVFVKNMDDTNFVLVDSASTYDKFPQKVFPGKGVYLMPQTGTIHVKADTAPCKIFIVSAG